LGDLISNHCFACRNEIDGAAYSLVNDFSGQEFTHLPYKVATATTFTLLLLSMLSIVSVTKVSVLQARLCGTVCHRTYNKTITSRVSSIKWKHFCLGVSQVESTTVHRDCCYYAP